MCVGAAWAVPDEAPWAAKGQQLKPRAVTEEEEVTSLIREVIENSSNMGHSSRSSGDGARLLSQWRGGLGRSSLWYLHGCGAHPLA